MRNLYLIALFIFGACLSTHAQYLVSAELLYSWTPVQLTNQGVFGAENDVSMYKVTYNTIDPQGEPTIATGAMFIPELEWCSLPMAVYNHGTIYEKDDVPSTNNGEALIGKYMGAFGYVGVLPDYLGLGDSPGLHPYVHADSEASATIDMMRAAQEFCEDEEIELNGQHFFTGYSQGGHAAMATVYEIETNLSEEFTVTASAPASGPYDISDTQATPISSDQPYASPEYLPYVIFSYQSVYGTLYDEPSDFLVAPYDTLLPPMFDGTFSGGEIAAVMPEVPSEIIQPDELDAFINDPNHPMRIALEDNDRYDWTPESPMRLYYCTGDEQVFHENSLVTHTVMESNGASDVSLMEMGDMDHGGCAQPALFDILFWFNDLKEECAVSIAEVDGLKIEVFPNPASTEIQLRLSEPHNGLVRFHDMTGKTVFQSPISGSQTTVNIESLRRGAYIITIKDMPEFHEQIIVR